MYRVGVDLGGTNIRSGVVDDQFKIIGVGELKTNAPRPAAEIFDDITKTVHMAVEAAGLTMDDISSVGVGTPGTVNKTTGYIEFSNNLDFQNVPAQEMLRERLGKPARVSKISLPLRSAQAWAAASLWMGISSTARTLPRAKWAIW